jgi:hypothetical protein
MSISLKAVLVNHPQKATTAECFLLGSFNFLREDCSLAIWVQHAVVIDIKTLPHCAKSAYMLECGLISTVTNIKMITLKISCKLAQRL